MSKLIAFLKNKTGVLIKIPAVPGRLVLRTLREFNRDQCASRASSLAFSTLLAVVPLTAFVFSLLTAFGTFTEFLDDMQELLLQILLPTKQDELRILMDQFIKNSQALGTVGLILFAVTSLNLINNITMNLNAVWGSRPRNNYLNKLSVYTSTLIFGAMFIAASFTGRKFLSRLLPFESHPLWSVFLFLLPSLLMFFTFLLLIMAVPRARVKGRYAAAGALVGVVLWELAKAGFVSGSNYVLRASIMYGSLAVIPIFLFWLYIMWMIILGAAELTYCLQFRGIRGKSTESYEKMEPARKIALGVQLFLSAALDFRNGDKPPAAARLADDLGISLADVNAFVSCFESRELLRVLGKHRDSIIPARPLEMITFKELIGSLLGTGWDSDEVPEQLQNLLKDIRRDMESSIKNLSVEDYFAEEIIRGF